MGLGLGNKMDVIVFLGRVVFIFGVVLGLKVFGDFFLGLE